MTNKSNLVQTAEDADVSLQQILQLGSKQGFLTLEQVRLHLRDTLSASAESEEGLISKINGLGIAVYEQAAIERPMGDIRLGPDGCSVTFSYICNLKWEDLTDIGEERVRLCTGCNQFVKQIEQGDDILAETAHGFCGTFK